jgi:hypothetical protein
VLVLTVYLSVPHANATDVDARRIIFPGTAVQSCGAVDVRTSSCIEFPIGSCSEQQAGAVCRKSFQRSSPSARLSQRCRVSEAHLFRYGAEFDFRYNTRVALGFSDMQRAERIAAGMAGKRLTYRRTDERPNVYAGPLPPPVPWAARSHQARNAVG